MIIVIIILGVVLGLFKHDVLETESGEEGSYSVGYLGKPSLDRVFETSCLIKPLITDNVRNNDHFYNILLNATQP